MSRLLIPNEEDLAVKSDEDSLIEPKEDEQTNISIKATNISFLRTILLEVFFFLYSIRHALTMNCQSDLYLHRACLLELNKTRAECHSNDTAILNSAQVIAVHYTLYHKLITMVPAGIVLMFLGPWSDKYGKKKPMIFAVLCDMVSDAGMIWFASRPSIPLYWSLIVYIPSGLSGSHFMVHGFVYSLASTASSLRSRMTKYTLIQIAALLSTPLATWAGGFIYAHYGYGPVFIVGLICTFLSLVCICFVKEQSERTGIRWTRKIKDIFSCDGIKEMFTVSLRERENSGRAELLFLLLAHFIIKLSISGENGFFYFYCKEMYHWSLPYFSNVKAIEAFSSSLFLMIFVPLLSKKFGVRDMWIGVQGLLSSICTSLVQAFATHPWMYFMSLALGITKHTSQITVLSRISKIGDENETGKIFSFVSLVETLSPMVGSLIMTQIYDASIGFFPGLFLVVGAAVLVIPVIIFIWIIRLTKNIPPTVWQEDYFQEEVHQSEDLNINSSPEEFHNCDDEVLKPARVSGSEA